MASQPAPQPVQLARTAGPPAGTVTATAQDLDAAAEGTQVPPSATAAPAMSPRAARPNQQNDPSLVDLGWGANPNDIGPLVKGISNEDVWLLLRRFNNVIFHLKHSERGLMTGALDATVSPEQEFSPNKMRSQLERLYMSVIVGALAGIKHISRLRSWNEKTRTGSLCAAYFTLWVIDLVVFGMSVLALALVMSPKVRSVLFPPAPVSMVDTLSGNLTKPNSGVLGSKDSITGSPENFKGEAVENEASNFVTALGAIAVNIMTGKDPQGEANSPEDELNGPMQSGPDQLAVMVASGKDKAEGVERPSQDKSKVAMMSMMWAQVRPAMHSMTTVCDLVEKIANALNPKPPFHAKMHRIRLASAIAPLVVVSPFLSRDVVCRSITFLTGLVFFGSPVLEQAYHWLKQGYPQWTASLNVNNSLLFGVPTDPQLALALLRQGEATKRPLPPPPRLRHSPSQVPVALTDDVLSAIGHDQPLGASDLELADAAAPVNSVLDDAGGNDTEATKNDGSKEPHKFLRVFKGAAKAGVKGAVAFDKTRAFFGHEGAKNRAGVVPGKDHDAIAGPSEFEARYKGNAGFLCIDSSLSQPRLTFNKNSVVTNSRGPNPVWSLPVADIVALRKHSGYGFKTKLTAGWALDTELNDALGISDRSGNDWAVTALPDRDALFNRLVAMSTQTWEIW